MRTKNACITALLIVALVFALPQPRAKAVGLLEVAIALVVVGVVGTGVYVVLKAGKKLQQHQNDRMTNYADITFEYNDMDGTGWHYLTNVNDRPDSFTLLVTEVPVEGVEWPLLAAQGVVNDEHTHVVQLPRSACRMFRCN